MTKEDGQFDPLTDPDLSLANARALRHFDGNDPHTRLFMWVHINHFQEEDYLELIRSEALDWVIMPLRGIV